MKQLFAHLTVKLDPSLYLKDPESSEIGKEIVRVSVEMLSEGGLESFTFRKLAVELSSTESTIYRYFHNKQQLMMYLASWYWSVLEWRLAFATANLDDPGKQLERSLETLSARVTDLKETTHVNEILLHKIVVSESFKAFVMKGMEKKERIGYFSAYASLIDRLSGTISRARKNYPYPRALAGTLIETAHYQSFLLQSLPELTDIGKTPKNLYAHLYQIAFNRSIHP
jgi:AcrR family transcriptional regulator